jgi:hypothetical protein
VLSNGRDLYNIATYEDMLSRRTTCCSGSTTPRSVGVSRS